jgi:hypothetical protein
LFSGGPLLYPTAIAVVPTCGNGLVEADEKCDLGTQDGAPTTCCDETCHVVAGTTCTTTTTLSVVTTTTRTTTTTTSPAPRITTIPAPPTLPCTTAGCALEAAGTSAACAGQAIPAPVTAKFTKADNFINRSATTSPKKTRELLKKAKNALKQAKAKAIRATRGKKPKLSSDCAAAIESAAERVLARLGV